jgi:hypothetical protein
MSEYNFEIDPRITIEGIIASILDASELWDLLECEVTSPGTILLKYRPSGQLFHIEVKELAERPTEEE